MHVMKNIATLLFSSLLFVQFSLAKTTGITIPNIIPHYGSGGTFITPGVVNSRLIQQTYLTFNGTVFLPFDSTTYNYSSGRGGELSIDDMDDNFINFDESITYLFNPDNNAYRNQFHRTQTFNAANKVQNYTCQSWNTITNVWRDSARYLYTYNGDLTKLLVTNFQIFYGGIWANHVFYNNQYDASNNIITMSSTVFNMHFTYDANNNLIQRKDSIWELGLGWHDYDRLTFSYDASNKMTSYVVENFTNTTWQNAEKYEYVYIGNNVLQTIEYTWSNNAWTISGKHSYTYDSNDNKLTDTYNTYDLPSGLFVNSYILLWTYNNFNQPVTYGSQTWDVAANAWTYTTDDFLYRYYYQNYFPTDVNTIDQEKIAVNLFPVPASENINIDAKFERNKNYQLNLFDVQGKLIKSLNGHANTLHQTISVAELQSGNYFINLIVGDQKVSKKFIVAH